MSMGCNGHIMTTADIDLRCSAYKFEFFFPNLNFFLFQKSFCFAKSRNVIEWGWGDNLPWVFCVVQARWS